MPERVVITGASSGLGRAAAEEVAATGRHVVLACRDADAGATAADEIRARVPDASLEVLELDLADLASVRAAAKALLTGPPLGALVCNAGVQVVGGVRRSRDGHELTFATNHLGHFLLARLLLDHLAEAGRIVLVSSGTHYGPRRSMGFPAPHWESPGALADPELSVLDDSPRSGRIRYATSKLANIYTTYELNRRRNGRRITVNAFDPGLMPQTGLVRDYPGRVRRLYDRIAPVLVRAVPGVRSVARSAADLAWLVTADEPGVVSGLYFVGRRPRKTSDESYDRARAFELWEFSERLVSE
ncbi:SDR family NAD(P)-dependent oxidoreductase [Saccharopolyspora erythraea]|uniref:SDR family NAD(P)-dependent oxidoreductase n=1 Tax=Saccharopolyspora erythraea TaxID=1836 RepID=UPI001BAA2816|nr:SDR family NAD(P)-dependent oxidoreductase [Saccharopolyspora erythraea]QUH01169.1 SDR family NAD(P)-dependent oxidoreductase [Saccharopolyspora erythraea]